MPRSSGVHPCTVHTSLYHPSSAQRSRRTTDKGPSPVHPGKTYANSSTNSCFDPITKFINDVRQEYYLTHKKRSLGGLVLFAVEKAFKPSPKNINPFTDKLAQQF